MRSFLYQEEGGGGVLSQLLIGFYIHIFCGARNLRLSTRSAVGTDFWQVWTHSGCQRILDSGDRKKTIRYIRGSYVP